MRVEVSVQDCFYESSLLDASNSKLSHNYADRIAAKTWDTWFHLWFELLHHDLPKAPSYELSLRLTNDQEIQELNAHYRAQDQPTDVLAFAALEVDFPQATEMRSHLPLYIGDIVISVDTADRQAAAAQHTLQTELAWLAAHGLLHLLGWDHPDDDSLTTMLNQQTILVQTIGFDINCE